MHEENILGNTPTTPPASFSLSLVGILLVKTNTSQRLKYRQNRDVSTVPTVFETLKNTDFHQGDSQF